MDLSNAFFKHIFFDQIANFGSLTYKIIDLRPSKFLFGKLLNTFDSSNRFFYTFISYSNIILCYINSCK